MGDAERALTRAADLRQQAFAFLVRVVVNLVS
jgi:hypothetical protein